MIENNKIISTIIHTWGIDKTIKILLLGFASGMLTIGVCSFIIPNSQTENVLEKENM